jgi:ribosomal protein S28E/S33
MFAPAGDRLIAEIVTVLRRLGGQGSASEIAQEIEHGAGQSRSAAALRVAVPLLINQHRDGRGLGLFVMREPGVYGLNPRILRNGSS